MMGRIHRLLVATCALLLATSSLSFDSPFSSSSSSSSLQAVSAQLGVALHEDIPFCFPLSSTAPALPYRDGESSRVLQSLQNPLYAKNITLLVIRPGALFSLYTWIAKILIQERLGYRTSLMFTGLSIMEFYVNHNTDTN